jgi:hypothetical protein
MFRLLSTPLPVAQRENFRSPTRVQIPAEVLASLDTIGGHQTRASQEAL